MAYQITIQDLGQQFSGKAYDSVLDSAIQAGLNLPYGCKNGTCGNCKGTIITGSVDYGEHSSAALTETEKAEGKALFCCALPLSDLTIASREVLSDVPPPRILPARVEQITKLNDRVVDLQIQLPKQETLQFKAGQYIEFILKNGKRRAFSIANAPHQDNLLNLHIGLVEGGEFTHYIFNELQTKTILRIEAPLGSFYLREATQKPVIMLAGGTGFAPIKGIIEYMIHNEIKREIHLYWGARTLKDLYMLNLAKNWADQYSTIHFTPVLSKPLLSDQWQGRVGYVQDALLIDLQNGKLGDIALSDVEVYCCGVPKLVESSQKTLFDAGLLEDAFFADIFSFTAPTT